MADRSYKLTLSLSDGSTINAGTITAPQGPNGANGTNGATFTPSVSAAGVLSWTNNGGLTNPPPISIKGPKGDDAVITASDVENWGFTKNKGTVTSVAVKINGTIKGTVTSSGTIDLGTVLTEHQDISGKANLLGGNTFTGKQTLNSPGSDGYSIDASGYVKGSWLQASAIANKGANTGKVCVFDNSGWIYYRTPSEILAEAGGAKAGDIPDVSGKANLSGGNSWTGNQQFNNGSYYFATASDRYLTVEDEDGNAYISMNSVGFDLDADGLGNTQFMIAGNAGTSGQVLTSKGAGKRPQWTTIKVSTRKNSILSVMAKCQALSKEEWVETTSFGTTFFTPGNIWTDGDNVYYSDTLVLDKSTSTWIKKTWNGGYSFAGQHVWTDGDNIYYSNGSKEYVLNKETSTWTTKTWNGLPSSLRGLGIWTDGDNIYYSWNSTNYVLDKATSTWSAKTWSGLTSINAKYIWTDGDNIYYSNASNQYVLNKKTSTWSAKTWSGLTNFYGSNVWTDGDNIYYSNGSSSQYILDKKTSTWTTKNWTRKPINIFAGDYVWTDGDNIYHTYSSNGKSTTYILNRTPVSVNAKPAFN